MTLNISEVRFQFPALSDPDVIFFDNPAGTQVCQQVVSRVSDYLIKTNANKHGAFKSSRESDKVLTEARNACKDFYNASRVDEIVFGPNMTSLTL